MIRVGVISDTHDYLDPQVAEYFAGVNHIFHAGDIGLPWLLLQLQLIAPVTAVLGNNDNAPDLKEMEIVSLANRKFLVLHAVDPKCPSERLKRRIIQENPDVVIFGHTHKHHCQRIGQTLFFNPGYAGKPRFNAKRSVAILNCDNDGITAEIKEL